MWLVGHYLGDPNNSCITVVDTPGTGDTEGRDCDHAMDLAESVKQIGSIETFLLMFKGTNSRFTRIKLHSLYYRTLPAGLKYQYKTKSEDMNHYLEENFMTML